MRSIRIFVGHVFECYSCMTRWKPIPLSIDFVFPSSSYSDVDLRQYRRFVAEASGRISIEQYSGIKAAYTLHASTHNVWWSIAIPTATYQFICMLRDQIRLLVIFFFLFFWLPSSRCFSCAHHFFLICCCCCGRRYLTVYVKLDICQMFYRCPTDWAEIEHHFEMLISCGWPQSWHHFLAVCGCHATSGCRCDLACYCDCIIALSR